MGNHWINWATETNVGKIYNLEVDRHSAPTSVLLKSLQGLHTLGAWPYQVVNDLGSDYLPV